MFHPQLVNIQSTNWLNKLVVTNQKVNKLLTPIKQTRQVDTFLLTET